MVLNGMRPTGVVCFLIVVFALVLLFKMQTLGDYSIGLVSGPSPPFAGREGGVGTSMYSPPNGKVFSIKELSLLLAEEAVNNNNNNKTQ